MTSKIEQFLRKIFRRCQHNWKFESMLKLNEFGEEENHEILSSREYSMQRCTKCNKVKFRKL